jgi:hypothetical protein
MSVPIFGKPGMAPIVSRPLFAPTLTEAPRSEHYLQEALIFAAYGWSVLPVRGKKSAMAAWGPLQIEPMDDLALGEAFRRSPSPTGLAVILGHVSGWLTCRDFDTVESFRKWATRYPDLASRCPTVKTRRGFHVYFRNLDRCDLFFKWADGDVRGASTHYVLLPPSEHPDGGSYKWLRGEPSSLDAFPWIRLKETGFIDGDHPAGGHGGDNWNNQTPIGSKSGCPGPPQKTTNRNKPGQTGTPTSSVKRGHSNKDNSEGLSPSTGPHPVRSPVELVEDAGAAVSACVPHGPGERHQQIFNLCRILKGLPSYANKSALEAKEVFAQWFDRARPRIGTKDWKTSWRDFKDGWTRVRSPMGVHLAEARHRLRSGPIPATVCGFSDEPTRVLFALCVSLSAQTKGGVFFLSSRQAEAECGCSHVTAANRLRKFVHDGVLKLVTPGLPSATLRVAPRFRVSEVAAAQFAMGGATATITGDP